MVRSIQWFCVLALPLALVVQVRGEEAVKGTIKVADPARNEVVLKGVIKDTVYELDKGANVWLDGMRSKLGALKADDQAVVTYEKKGDHFMARQVRALRNAKETSGTVRSTFAEKGEITLKGVVKDTTYHLKNGATVWVNGKEGRLSDLREGTEVLITYEQRGDQLVANDVSTTKQK